MHRRHAPCHLSITLMPGYFKERGKPFGYLLGVSYSAEFNKNIDVSDSYKECFEPVLRAKQNYDKIVAGRIVGFISSPEEYKFRFQQSAKYRGLVLHPYVVVSESVFFGISKVGVDDQTLQKLQESFASLSKDGTFQRIRDEWAR